jgi:hypothetical protein
MKYSRKKSDKKKPLIIPFETEKEIIDYFLTHKDNRISVLSEHFGISIGHINGIIDRHFKDKNPVKY